jgi:SAM-dependent methyltransferase
MLRFLYDHLPPRTRIMAKTLLASAGHRASFLDPIRGRHHAKTQKRFANVARDLFKEFELAGITSLRGKRCLEYGCGYVLTEAAYYWLLGASQIVAVDYNRIAQFQYLRIALHGADEFHPGIEQFSPAMIEYLAPFDARYDPIPQVDFIRSNAVLEHIPAVDVPVILQRLSEALQPGGMMLHTIDLKDHLDAQNDPNGFLRDPSYKQSDCDTRGNRLRKSDWLRIFSTLKGLQTSSHPTIEPFRYRVDGYSDEDLSTVRLFLVSTKRE